MVALSVVVVSFEMTVYGRMIRPYSLKDGEFSVTMIPDFLRLCCWDLAVEVEAETCPDVNPSDVPPLICCYRSVDFLVLVKTKALVAAPR